ncbi:hypothetical protein CC99x_009275 [Candidatus Berkiella cookevillensis]|uniref:Uncharacterized protein n=1 Tax=Candidatus Berkiella cookevillensis TaxID=437022 RepID=A0A0Q9YKV7_9GAMM|nr:hypothetical protein [Candidatus Berkiella cookevillensis]MCS5709094.1 hypothetical protein [Candidatus Berkiella cookevillensis]
MKYALLIEGVKGVQLYQNGDFTQALSGPNPEIYHMHEIAKANGWDYFDPIVSFDLLHIFHALTKFPATQHERVVHVVLDFFRSSTPIDKLTLQLFVLPAYQQFLANKGETVLPAWLARLSQSNNQEIAKQKQDMIKTVYCKYAKPVEKYKEENELILKWMLDSSNRLSAIDLKRYLDEHPDVTHVVGLVGLTHLAMLDKFSIKVKTPFSCLAECKIGERLVNITLFGSVHGERTGLTMLSNYLQKMGFKTQNDEMLASMTQNAGEFVELAGIRAITNQFDRQCAISENTASENLIAPSSQAQEVDNSEKVVRNSYF